AEQMEAEGVTFHYCVNVDAERMRDLADGHDAVLLATGAERPRDPGLPGMDLEGVHYAMPFLVQQNMRVGREAVEETPILASGRHVVVIGGGDTASDCIGTSIRQGALSVTQMDIRPMPPIRENKDIVWPYWPTKFRTSSSQAEGADREFAAATLEIVGKRGRATHVRCARVDEKRKPLPGTEFDVRADLILIAIGFSGPILDTYVQAYEFDLDARTNLKANTDDYRTNIPNVYAAGDARRGQSLVVWAIREGRQAARSIDLDLMGSTTLPR
ncbi:MAG: FAD-dependent oxidoreductase, partial [Pseudomonadota bacterium]